jgi:hypothetical protein
MHHDQIHKQFVRENVDFLTSEKLDGRSYKDAYKDIERAFYYVKHRNKFGHPAPKELMQLLVAHLQITMSDDRIHELIESLPFFKLTGENERKKLHELVKKHEVTSVLSPEEARAVKDVGMFEAAKMGKIEEVEKAGREKTREIELQIEARKRELAELPSILDDEEIVEPEFDPEIESRRTWWERFYLQADPFPRKDGLSAIDESRYESIIIKTEPFQKILSLLNRDEGALFSTGFLLVGDYGYGKTTFIDYLSHFLIHKEILPLRITSAKPFADASGFVDSFLNKLRLELRKEFRTVLHREPEDLKGVEVEDEIRELCQKLCERRAGMVIFMDDFHKFKAHFRQIFEFLGTLQVLKDTLARSGAKVGFIVSGVPGWQEELRQNSQMVGFLDGAPIVLPEVSPELICEVFNKRIEAFCFDGSPRKIKPQFVRNLVSDLGGEQGIRGCINRIIEELSNNNLAIVDSPVEVSDESLGEIKRTLEGSPRVKDALNKLLYQTRFQKFSNEQIMKCLELVVTIHVQSGIAEADQQFKENQFYFKVLRDTNLIQRQRAKPNRPLQWNLSQPMQDIFRLIAGRFELSPADYLLKIYAYRTYQAEPQEAGGGLGDKVARLKAFFGEHVKRMDTATSEAINSGLQRLERLILRPTGQVQEERDVTTAREGLELMTLGLGLLDGSEAVFQRIGLQDYRRLWELKPGATPEIISEAYDRLMEHESHPTVKSRSHAIKTSTDALREISHRAFRLGEEIFTERDPLLHRPSSHTDEELELFTTIQEGFYSAAGVDHFDYMKALVDYLELRFRNFFYFTSSLVFGPKYFEQCPQGIRKYAQANIDRRSSSVGFDNSFDGLTRSQFKQIFLQNNNLLEHCVKPLQLSWPNSDWETFSNNFSKENILVAHNQEKAYSQAEKITYRRFAASAEQILAGINELVANTISKNLFIVELGNVDNSTPFGIVAVFRTVATDDFPASGDRVFSSWPDEKRSFKGVFQRVIEYENYIRVIGAIQAKLHDAPGGILIQDLLDIDFIQSHYRITAADFVSILAIGHHRTKSLRIFPWFGSSIAILPPIEISENDPSIAKKSLPDSEKTKEEKIAVNVLAAEPATRDGISQTNLAEAANVAELPTHLRDDSTEAVKPKVDVFQSEPQLIQSKTPTLPSKLEKAKSEALDLFAADKRPSFRPRKTPRREDIGSILELLNHADPQTIEAHTPSGTSAPTTDLSDRTLRKDDSPNLKQVIIRPPILVPELAARLGLKPFNIMADLIKIGAFPAPNQPLDPVIAAKVCEIHGFTFECLE